MHWRLAVGGTAQGPDADCARRALLLPEDCLGATQGDSARLVARAHTARLRVVDEDSGRAIRVILREIRRPTQATEPMDHSKQCEPVGTARRLVSGCRCARLRTAPRLHRHAEHAASRPPRGHVPFAHDRLVRIPGLQLQPLRQGSRRVAARVRLLSCGLARYRVRLCALLRELPRGDRAHRHLAGRQPRLLDVLATQDPGRSALTPVGRAHLRIAAPLLGL